jgi:hypothetical protein
LIDLDPLGDPLNTPESLDAFEDENYAPWAVDLDLFDLCELSTTFKFIGED